jgi:hypothetical protein
MAADRLVISELLKGRDDRRVVFGEVLGGSQISARKREHEQPKKRHTDY